MWDTEVRKCVRFDSTLSKLNLAVITLCDFKMSNSHTYFLALTWAADCLLPLSIILLTPCEHTVKSSQFRMWAVAEHNSIYLMKKIKPKTFTACHVLTRMSVSLRLCPMLCPQLQSLPLVNSWDILINCCLFLEYNIMSSCFNHAVLYCIQ